MKETVSGCFFLNTVYKLQVYTCTVWVKKITPCGLRFSDTFSTNCWEF